MSDRIGELKKAVKAGKIEAAFSLAEALKWGYYGEADPFRAARMYRICCRSRNPEIAAKGYYNLGILYQYGLISPEPEKKEVGRAFTCFLKSVMLCPTGEALSKLADMYRYGQYVEQNEAIALSLYEKASLA